MSYFDLLTVDEIAALLEDASDVAKATVFIEPPENALVSDGDSDDEDPTCDINKLSGNQLRARAEVICERITEDGIETDRYGVFEDTDDDEIPGTPPGPTHVPWSILNLRKKQVTNLAENSSEVNKIFQNTGIVAGDDQQDLEKDEMSKDQITEVRGEQKINEEDNFAEQDGQHINEEDNIPEQVSLELGGQQINEVGLVNISEQAFLEENNPFEENYEEMQGLSHDKNLVDCDKKADNKRVSSTHKKTKVKSKVEERGSARNVRSKRNVDNKTIKTIAKAKIPPSQQTCRLSEFPSA